MKTSNDHTPQVPHLGPTTTDYFFLAFLALVLVAVTWLGIKNYGEGLKTETSKLNGETWAAWMTEAGTTRFDENTKHPACKGGVKPGADAKPDAPGTWGACLKYLMTETELKDLVNPFFKEPPKLIAQCVPSDRSTPGAIVIEDLMPTPAGSALPFVASQLVEADPIDYKMQLRITVCDKGGYPIKITELEF
ncbi:hypothetical protein B9Z39_15480 [Limnohabitans sp. JirII-29]|uniref:hypothetical protein n=1 Tax=unclassified Limnohabitans TaxID=2626134 RepID=UPI000C1E9D14|nr:MULTISPECIES: hypothetical protein [unclassified Limnohabitans]PIT73517.1 hypothetical protein B9Z41_14525 [Limnohabitans sp. JirII-31]PUE23447.1 hypothetical protein B9Z39_15480 [Limnohabitans sp. JirII-29]